MYKLSSVGEKSGFNKLEKPEVRLGWVIKLKQVSFELDKTNIKLYN